MPDIHKDRLSLSRRAFLQTIAFTSGGVILASCAPTDLEPEPIESEIRTLRVAWGGAPATLDPANASADVEIAFLTAVYDYLVDTNTDNEITPRLAHSWETSEDGLRYTFNLVDTVFHDGQPFTADDVVWSFERLRTADSAAATLLSNIERIEATEPNRIVFYLRRTDPDFLFTLSDNRTLIFKAESTNIGSEFNGTGPFKVVNYLFGDRTTLERNPDYFAGAPGTDLEFVYFDDNTAAVGALRSGGVDIVLRLDNATFLSLPEGDFRKAEVQTSGHDLIRLRQDRGPGADPNVVLAFKHATNRQAIFDRVQLGFGTLGSDTPIGPVYSDFYSNSIQPPDYDPRRARQLLEQAGYADGLEITLHVPDSGDRVALADTLVEQWEEAGIIATVERQDEATYYAEDQWLEVDLGITPWGARPTPQFFLSQAYRTDAIWNETKISDPELDSLIDLAGSTLDADERVEAYQQIQEIINERGSVIIPYFFSTFGVFALDVEGVDLHPFAGRTSFLNARFTAM